MNMGSCWLKCHSKVLRLIKSRGTILPWFEMRWDPCAWLCLESWSDADLRYSFGPVEGRVFGFESGCFMGVAAVVVSLSHDLFPLFLLLSFGVGLVLFLFWRLWFMCMSLCCICLLVLCLVLNVPSLSIRWVFVGLFSFSATPDVIYLQVHKIVIK